MSISYITEETPAGDFEAISVSTAVKQIDAAKLVINQAGGRFKRAVRVFITVAVASIRLRFDGTDPSATVGHILAAGDSIIIEGEQNVSRIRMIAVSGDGVASVTIFYNA